MPRKRNELAQARCTCREGDCARGCQRMAYVVYGGHCLPCREGVHNLLPTYDRILNRRANSKLRTYVKGREKAAAEKGKAFSNGSGEE